MTKALINIYYINDKTYGSPENTRKRKISHILENAPTNATEYNNEKRVAQKNINTNNTSISVKIVKNKYKRIAPVAW